MALKMRKFKVCTISIVLECFGSCCPRLVTLRGSIGKVVLGDAGVGVRERRQSQYGAEERVELDARSGGIRRIEVGKVSQACLRSA